MNLYDGDGGGGGLGGDGGGDDDDDNNNNNVELLMHLYHSSELYSDTPNKNQMRYLNDKRHFSLK